METKRRHDQRSAAAERREARGPLRGPEVHRVFFQPTLGALAAYSDPSFPPLVLLLLLLILPLLFLPLRVVMGCVQTPWVPPPAAIVERNIALLSLDCCMIGRTRRGTSGPTEFA
ncbi:unnamed protein product [Prorocentrum cordatum]|uniref:Uncharacterized protein n=1 Tax=Prorocentrum cordatum TaxID=2364126 RepID=A0ABN9PP41_9DINO|nr:unnamed protein product [Polarella glacialis]